MEVDITDQSLSLSRLRKAWNELAHPLTRLNSAIREGSFDSTTIFLSLFERNFGKTKIYGEPLPNNYQLSSDTRTDVHLLAPLLINDVESNIEAVSDRLIGVFRAFFETVPKAMRQVKSILPLVKLRDRIMRLDDETGRNVGILNRELSLFPAGHADGASHFSREDCTSLSVELNQQVAALARTISSNDQSGTTLPIPNRQRATEALGYIAHYFQSQDNPDSAAGDLQWSVSAAGQTPFSDDFVARCVSHVANATAVLTERRDSIVDSEASSETSTQTLNALIDVLTTYEELVRVYCR